MDLKKAFQLICLLFALPAVADPRREGGSSARDRESNRSGKLTLQEWDFSGGWFGYDHKRRSCFVGADLFLV